MQRAGQRRGAKGEAHLFSGHAGTKESDLIFGNPISLLDPDLVGKSPLVGGAARKHEKSHSEGDHSQTGAQRRGGWAELEHCEPLRGKELKTLS